MEDLIENIKKALRAEAWYLALVGALILPDICGAMEHPNGRASEDNYKKWFDAWVGEKYKTTFPDGGKTIFLSAKECYAFRSSLLHQGRSGQNAAPIRHIAFVPPSKAGGYYHLLRSHRPPGLLTIDLLTFCNDVANGVIAWSKTKEGDVIVERNYADMIRLHPTGIPGAAFGGFPIIG